MCLGIPGKVTSVQNNPMGLTMGTVEFGGVAREVCLAYTPEARPGDWVIVHAGFAISLLDEEEAQLTLQTLAELAADGEEDFTAVR